MEAVCAAVPRLPVLSPTGVGCAQILLGEQICRSFVYGTEASRRLAVSHWPGADGTAGHSRWRTKRARPANVCFDDIN